MNQLIPLEKVNALEVFGSEETIQILIDRIREAAVDFDPDVSTPAGRKIIAAQARKVATSKGVIDSAGKALTEDWFKKKKVVDAGRRFARESLDALRDEIRAPLTEWEAEEKRKLEEIALKAEIEADEIEAHERNDFLDREARVLALEAKLEREENERQEKARLEAEEKARLEREEKLRQEAEEIARQDASDEIQREKDAREQAERDRIAAEEKAEQDKKDAAEKAEREQREAVERAEQNARDEADRLERERIRREEDEQREAQARAADRENRRTINRAAVEALVQGGVSKTSATKAVTLIASGHIPSISIRY